MWFFTSHLLNKTASNKQLVADYISQIILILDHCLLTIIAFAALGPSQSIVIFHMVNDSSPRNPKVVVNYLFSRRNCDKAR